jgi:transposase InsO family protein
MCEVLDVSKSGYYDWAGREDSPREARKNELVDKIAKIHLGSRHSYGSPRVFEVLKGMGEKCSKSTVERLMREKGIRAKAKKKFKATTDSEHALPVAANVVGRKFNVEAPNRLWCTDITYLWTTEGWLYLAIVLDAFTRKVVGWSMKPRMSQDLVLDALDMAFDRQRPARGLVHHSDRGSQYASKAYQRRLWRYGMVPSMSRKGNCWDNALAESFFHTLKTEHVFHEVFVTRNAARNSVFEWIEVFYNRQRVHSSLGFVTPECYERRSFQNIAYQ